MRMPGLEWLKPKASIAQALRWEEGRVPESQPVRRLRIVARLAFLWAVIVLARLVQLQILRHEEWRHLAQAQQEKTVEIRAPRGNILDRNGRPLAMSLPVDSVCVNPLRIPDLELAAEVLGSVLSLDREQVLAKIRIYRELQKGFLWVKRKISPEESARLRRFGFQWVEFRTESRRFYPKGELAAHVVGSVDHQEQGVVGLEASFEEDLEGRPGAMRVVSDSKQRGIDTVVSTEPVAGANVVTTVDERIQYVAERELRKAVTENNCKTGSAVVMNPYSGEILAMASYPTFDPNEPPREGEDLSSRLNLAVSAPFEPGSVFKVITLAAALETTSLRPETVIPCGNGIINLFGRIIHDHDRYAALPMVDVLAKSSNIGAIQVGLKVGERTLYDYVRRFGFGRETGIAVPAESAGLVRKLKAWQPSSIGSVAIGHEVSTTTVQLAQAGAVVANGGLLVRPRITIKSQRPGERMELVNAQQPRRVIRPETATTMRLMMEAVVLRGTGKKAQLRGYTSGGKTGSAQIFDFDSRAYTHKYNASFLGFAPLNNPAIVAVVTLNGASKYGGAVAAPVFREVALAALRILDVPRDLPDRAGPETADEPEATNDLALAEVAERPAPAMLAPSLSEAAAEARMGAPAATMTIAGREVPNFQGKTMRGVFETASSLGFEVEYAGNGIARTQFPAPGALLGPGERIRIQFAR